MLLIECDATRAALLSSHLSQKGYDVALRPEIDVWDGSANPPDLVLLGRTASTRCDRRDFDQLATAGAGPILPAFRPSLLPRLADAPSARRGLAIALQDCGNRVRQHFARAPLPDGLAIQWGDLLFHLHPKFVAAGDRAITLTRYEGDLLAVLMSRGGEIVSTDALWRVVFDGRSTRDTNVVEVHLSRLRAKLAQSQTAVRIETVRGYGYVLFWRPPGAFEPLPLPAVRTPSLTADAAPFRN